MSSVAGVLTLILLLVGAERRRHRRRTRLRDALWLPVRSGPPREGVLIVGGGVALGLGLLLPPQPAASADPVDAAPALVIAVDVSRSMLVEDVVPHRLGHAVAHAIHLVAATPDRPIGLVAFAGDANLVVPPTIDHTLVGHYLDALDPGGMAAAGSDVSDAIGVALQALGPAVSPGSAVVVFSDGEAFEDPGRRDEAAREAADAGIPVHWVTVGTSGGGPVPGEAASARSMAVPGTGRAIAERTGGLALEAGAPGVVAKIGGALAESDSDRSLHEAPPSRRRAGPGAPFWAGLAFVLLAAESLLGLRREPSS